MNDFMSWLQQFIVALQNPSFLIFFCSLIVGAVIKNTQIPIPNWLIPSVLALIGIVAGAVLLGNGAQGRFQGAITGLTLSLASTGCHQVYTQIIERYGKKNENPSGSN